LQKTITVFGSSKPKPGEPEYETASRLGRLLGKNNFNVCTGGYYGIMEAVSKGAAGMSSEIIGITIKEWQRKANSFVTREIKCNSLFERITKLIETGDAFVILQGGTGTLLELAAAWEMMNKNLSIIKPVFCHSKLWEKIITR
jgi:uncharacterized protein (TIGR00725 family)